MDVVRLARLSLFWKLTSWHQIVATSTILATIIGQKFIESLSLTVVQNATKNTRKIAGLSTKIKLEGNREYMHALHTHKFSSILSERTDLLSDNFASKIVLYIVDFHHIDWRGTWLYVALPGLASYIDSRSFY